MTRKLRRIDTSYYLYDTDTKEMNLLEDFEMAEERTPTGFRNRFGLFIFQGKPDIYYAEYGKYKESRHVRGLPLIETFNGDSLKTTFGTIFNMANKRAIVVTKRLIKFDEKGEWL